MDTITHCMNIFERERTSTEVVMYACIILVLYGLKFQKYIKSNSSNHLEKKEGAILPYGNGFRGSINQSYTYLLLQDKFISLWR